MNANSSSTLSPSAPSSVSDAAVMDRHDLAAVDLADLQEGDIAFLRPAAAYSYPDLVAITDARPFGRGSVPVGATGHPCIILRSGPDRLLVTTVSAYAAGPENEYRPPWRKPGLESLDPEDFRSFAGSEPASDAYPALQLLPGQTWPKPRTSWVHVQNAWVVPRRVAGRFTKPRHGCVLRMTVESLDELRADMAARCRVWWRRVWEFETGTSYAPPPLAAPPAPLVSGPAPIAHPALPSSVPSGPRLSPPSAPAFPAAAGCSWRPGRCSGPSRWCDGRTANEAPAAPAPEVPAWKASCNWRARGSQRAREPQGHRIAPHVFGRAAALRPGN